MGRFAAIKEKEIDLLYIITEQGVYNTNDAGYLLGC